MAYNMTAGGAYGYVSCLGIIDARPAAQGSLWIRFYEMCLSGRLLPYRYDVHVKRFDNGVLTPAEINAQTYFARSFFAEPMTGCSGLGSPAGSPGVPGVLQALIAFEAPQDITRSVVPNDENMHLFTSRQYWVAIRAVAIDPYTQVVYEDDNIELTLSYSSGHQGELWHRILDCVAIEGCPDAGLPVSMQVAGALDIDHLPDLVIAEINDEISAVVPPIDAFLRAGDDAGIVGLPGLQGGQ